MDNSFEYKETEYFREGVEYTFLVYGYERKSKVHFYKKIAWLDYNLMKASTVKVKT